MEENQHNNAASDKSGQEKAGQTQGDPGGVKRKLQVRRELLFGTIAAFLFVIADNLDNPFHKFLCLLASFFFGSLTLRLELRNYTATQNNANWWSVLLFIVAAILTGFAILPEKEKPRIVLSLKNSESPEYEVPLTNAFLYRKMETEFSPTERLFIPVKTPSSNVSLTFTVFNKSPVFADDVFLIIGFPKSWKAAPEREPIPGAGWKKGKMFTRIVDSNIGKPETDGFDSWSFEFPNGLLKNGGELPPIKTEPSKSDSEIVLLMVQGKNFPTFALATRIYFFVMPENFPMLPKPFFSTKPNDSNGRIGFSEQELKELQK